MVYFKAQNDLKIGPLRPIFSTPLKVPEMRMWSNTDVKPVKTFWENEQRLEFQLILGSKMWTILGLRDPYSTYRQK